MLSITLLFAFILSFALPEWRDKLFVTPIQSYCDWLIKTFSLQDSGWLPVFLIFPLVLAVGILEDWFEGFFFLVLFTLIAWAILDVPAVQSSEGNDGEDADFPGANSALFCGAVWFVLVHPFAGLTYRLIVWMTDKEELAGYDEWSSILRSIRGWMEWPATFVTSVFISLAGKARDGFRQFMLYPFIAENITELNEARVTSVGKASLGDEITDSATRADSARQLIIRAFLYALVVLWLVELAL